MTQTALITGGNSGLGFYCAAEIAKDPSWHVVIASRDEQRNNEAVETLKRKTKNPNIHALSLDLGSLQSVRDFAKEFAQKGYPPLRALVCNAGLQVVSEKRTQEGFELTFGVNHLGHFLLSNLLYPQLQAPARIVFVSSGTHNAELSTGMPKPAFTDAEQMAHPSPIPPEKIGEEGRRRYSTSKLCNVFCTYEFDRRLKAAGHKDILVTAFDPGLMPGTGLARDYSAFLQLFWKLLIPIITPFMPFSSTPKRSGRHLARLAVGQEWADRSGIYVDRGKEIPSSKESYDKEKAKKLWEDSARLVGLDPLPL
ncbi:MAG: SDR family NAD(P)-dependent oxidoreductase [Myxococcales bacterium]|nr:SDR family NAD(P)-dependent oxidoreductase [Myxococcales bacterium]